MKIILAPDGPLDVPATLARFHLWGEDPANRVKDDVFRRALRLDARLHPYEVPEIVELEMSDVAKPYLSWLVESTDGVAKKRHDASKR